MATKTQGVLHADHQLILTGYSTTNRIETFLIYN